MWGGGGRISMQRRLLKFLDLLLGGDAQCVRGDGQIGNGAGLADEGPGSL